MFTVNGQAVDLDRAAVFAALQGRRPRPQGQARYFIKVRRHYWPVTQALEAVLAATDWEADKPVPSPEARRVLAALGFPVVHQKERKNDE